MATKETDSLRVDCLLLKPRDFNWSERTDWEVVQPYEENNFSDDWEKNEENTGYSSYYDMISANQPMMDYYYPVPKELSNNNIWICNEARILL